VATFTCHCWLLFTIFFLNIVAWCFDFDVTNSNFFYFNVLWEQVLINVTNIIYFVCSYDFSFTFSIYISNLVLIYFLSIYLIGLATLWYLHLFTCKILPSAHKYLKLSFVDKRYLVACQNLKLRNQFTCHNSNKLCFY
jgi:hypothetical protein